jgi:ATP-dependent helicase/nuclease subunit B
MNLYTIPYGAPFLDSLVQGVMMEVGDDPLALAHLTILLPTRRSCRALRDAFLRYSNGKPLLLPSMLPIGDIDTELMPLSAESAIVPPIAPLRQLLLLTKLVQADPSQKLDIAQSCRLARDLAAFIAELQTEGVASDAFETLVPEEFADHWQHTLTFLRIIAHQWPMLLAAEGVSDPARYRNQLLEAQVASWKAHPPQHRIIAAGSTGSIPAVASLLGAVASLPQGAVILPALDREMEEESWKNLDDCHPQMVLKKLLQRLKCPREHVKLWGNPQADSSRAALISNAMRPAATSNRWQYLPAMPVQGITAITSATLQQQATVIAAMMREALDTPGYTATLITQERGLARRVASILQRWGIACDDSAGTPLSIVPAAVYMRLLAAMVDNRMAPVPLLSALKHPLTAAGMRPGAFRQKARELEITALRGVRPATGFAGLYAMLREGELKNWLHEIERKAANFIRLMRQKQADFYALLTAHLECAELLAATEEVAGDVRLWAGDAGEQLADFIRELLEHASDFGMIDTKSYSGLLDALLAGEVYRPRYGQHPRLTILSPLEARLHQADLMILGELNEDSWPKTAQTGPWVSRPMRTKLGLPLPEEQIGQSAHDFSCYLAAKKVVLARCEKKEGSPTVPSRWWLRLHTMLGESIQQLATDMPWNDWAELLHQPAEIIADITAAPCPPIASRPRRLSVTQVETLMRDPYSIYASCILKLRPLDALDSDPGAAEFGTFIHKVMELFINCYEEGGSHEQLLALGMELIDGATQSPAVKMLWLPRFERIAEWFAGYEQHYRRQGIIQSLTEVKGVLQLGDFTLTAKADRIDLLQGNSLCIIDYKTGSPPTQKAIEAGYAPQLTLEAVMAVQGVFAGLSPSIPYIVEKLSYIRLSGGDEAGEVMVVKNVGEPLFDAARSGLEALIAAYNIEAIPYFCCPSPDYVPAYNDYLHLARLR